MSDSELKYPSWQTPLQEAILEFNRIRRAEKIQKVEGLICGRLEAISSETDHQDKRQALADATSLLRVLNKQKLSIEGNGEHDEPE
jgi:hypothetical protein